MSNSDDVSIVITVTGSDEDSVDKIKEIYKEFIEYWNEQYNILPSDIGDLIVKISNGELNLYYSVRASIALAVSSFFEKKHHLQLCYLLRN